MPDELLTHKNTTGFSCSNCGTVRELTDDLTESFVVCKNCGFIVPISQGEEKQQAPTGPRPRPKNSGTERRGFYFIIGLYAVLLFALPFSIVYAKNGSPACLALFAVNLVVGTTGGFLFLSGMNDPDYLTGWLQLEFSRIRAALVFLPVLVIGFGVAYFTFHP